MRPLVSINLVYKLKSYLFTEQSNSLVFIVQLISYNIKKNHNHIVDIIKTVK